MRYKPKKEFRWGVSGRDKQNTFGVCDVTGSELVGSLPHMPCVCDMPAGIRAMRNVIQGALAIEDAQRIISVPHRFVAESRGNFSRWPA